MTSTDLTLWATIKAAATPCVVGSTVCSYCGFVMVEREPDAPVRVSYEFWCAGKRIGRGAFENDAEAEGFCKLNYLAEYARGIEMRCFEDAMIKREQGDE